MPRQEKKHIKLLRGQVNRFFLHGDNAAERVNDQSIEGECTFSLNLSLFASEAAHHGTNATHQLLWAERFNDVIVCTQFQTGDAVDFLSARCQHDDRHIGAIAQPTGEGETVYLDRKSVV